MSAIKLSAQEIICIQFEDKLQDVLEERCYIDITNLQLDGSGCDYTHETKSIKTLGFKYFDQYEGWVTNNLQSLDVMEAILNPPGPHSPMFLAHKNIIKTLTAARRYDYFLDITNLKEDGTGWLKIERADLKGLNLGYNYRYFYNNGGITVNSNANRKQCTAKISQLFTPF